MSSERQGEFLFEKGGARNDASDSGAGIDAEIAAVWRVPVGSRVRAILRESDVSGASGLLEIAEAPELPFDARRPLRLRIGDVAFTDRQIESWALV